MSVVIGTAGHIDHGKTTLLRALTGIDADRLPEERRRGMTLDVGYAHLDLDDGTAIDFIDVPGHDALIGNMLVGAGEIDAAMLIVAADDGPRAQTVEHLGLLDALGIRDGLVVITKADLAGADRAAEVVTEVRALIDQSSLAGAPVVIASGVSGSGVDELRSALVRLRDLILARTEVAPSTPRRLAVDRSFIVRGRGSVVTGTLRGGDLAIGDVVLVRPGGASARIRGLQVRHREVDRASPGRVAVNLAGVDRAQLPRGVVLTTDPAVVVTDRLLVALTAPIVLRGDGGGSSWPPRDGARLRLHVGTAAVGAVIGRRGREATFLPDGRATALLRLSDPLATFMGDRAVLRQPSPGEVAAGVRVLDAEPARGISRRRATAERLSRLAAEVDEGDKTAAADAIVALHGAVRLDGGLVLAQDIHDSLEPVVLDLVASHHRDQPLETGPSLSFVRQRMQSALRGLTAIRRDDADAADTALGDLIDGLVARRRLARDGDRLREFARDGGVAPDLAAAMDRLVALLSVPAPPPLADAARDAACPAIGIRTLEAEGRIVRVEADLAWSAPEFQRLVAVALTMARQEPLAPAALRDATGTSRRVVMPLLEDLGRRGILARTPAGHVPGPRAPKADGTP